MTANVTPHIEQSAGIGVGASWAIVGALILLVLVWLALALIGAADRTPPAPPRTRPTHRCQHGTGPNKCPGRATRLVLVILDGNHVESRLMCDADAGRMIRTGRAHDMGPIGGAGR